jgi:hypothetical protein
MTARRLALLTLMSSLFGQMAFGQTQGLKTLQPIPVGLDAYRAWDRWPEQRVGMRTYMRSTYDRLGANEGADASHFLYQEKDDFNVSLDLEGAGILTFVRYNHWHGSPWHFVVDGTDNVIRESSTEDPLHPVSDSVFIPGSAFPPPLNLTWATTKGADLLWTPIPFERSFRMAYSRTRYGTGYYIYSRFVPGIPLSQPLKTWNESDTPAKDVLDLLSRAGSDIAPTEGTKEESGAVQLSAGRATTLLKQKGRNTIRALKFSIPRDQAEAFTNTRLRITWDDRNAPSVDVPIALFFGAGTLYNRDNREYLVKALPVNIRFAGDKIEFACYFPMPYFKSAHLQLVAGERPVRNITWNLRYMPIAGPASRQTYFHANYKDFPNPTHGQDLELLDTKTVEGSDTWSGQFVGTSFIFSRNAELRTLEGDPRFFFDDSETPQAQGTGTEEWGGGGDYWGGLNMSLPLAGHPVGAKNAKIAVDEKDKIESAYRFLLADLMPFGKRAVIHLEHGGKNESTEHYETIAYWYGVPTPTLVETDKLQIGDEHSERAHRYTSPSASKMYTIKSRYELGVDNLDGVEAYPESEDQGRTMTGTSEFKLRLRSDNMGVLLRRKLDYSFSDQRAEVFIADDSKSNWKSAGVWYLSGSNTVVYSNPPDELGATRHVVQTSNRRFRDDEFLVPKEMTGGKKSISVRIKFTPVSRPLYPGYPIGQRAWSEMRYTAYCFISPKQ